jgi:hypothetical protein
MDNDFFNLKRGFATNSPNRNFDEGTGAMDWRDIGLGHSGGRPRGPKKGPGRNMGDPTKLMLSPDMSGGGSGGMSSGGMVIENKDYTFVVDPSVLPNGYSVGTGADRNLFRLNSGKAPLVITGPFTGRWLKFNPTLVRLGYHPSNQSGVVRISEPANLAGYEIPLRLLKKA